MVGYPLGWQLVPPPVSDKCGLGQSPHIYVGNRRSVTAPCLSTENTVQSPHKLPDARTRHANCANVKNRRILQQPEEKKVRQPEKGNGMSDLRCGMP